MRENLQDGPAEPPSASATAPRKGTPRAAFVFILVSITLDMMAGSLAGPVLPRLVRSVSGLGMVGVSQVFGALTTVFFVMQLFAGPVQGALSDRFGRRPVILASTFGLAADYVIMALAPNVGWLFVGRLITGAMAGGFAAAYAYLADVSEPQDMARQFGLVGAVATLGVLAGPMLGGFLASLNLRAPFWVAGAMGLASGVYGLFVLPESLPADRRAPLRFHNLHPLGAIAGVWRDFPPLRLWAAAFALTNLGLTGVTSIFAIYTTYRFGWGPKDIGLYATSIAIETVVVQSLVVGPIVRRLGDRRALIVGMAIQILAVLLAGLAVNGPEFWIAIAIMILGGFSGPAQMAILNDLVGSIDRGRLSGATRSLVSLSSIGAPVVFSLMFAATGADPKSLLAGAPFYLATVLMILAAFAILSATGVAKPPA